MARLKVAVVPVTMFEQNCSIVWDQDTMKAAIVDPGGDLPRIQGALADLKVVTRLAMAWQDKLSFVLDDTLAIRQLRFEDLLQEQAEQDGGDDALSQLDASFVLMMLTFREFLPALVEALGGEEYPQGLGDSRTASAGPAAEEESDPLYEDAVAFVRESGRASISAVQSKLKIGYNRAARMIERMEAEGVVTPMNSNGAREVIL